MSGINVSEYFALIKVIYLLPLNIKSSELVRILKKDGWFVIRQTGSHMTMIHPAKSGKVVCPFHGSNEVSKGLEIKILKDAGLK